MPIAPRLTRRAVLGSATAALLSPAVRAQSVPTQTGWMPQRTVTMVVPFAPGGTTDVMARLIAVPMAQQLGKSVVIENVTGAGGNIGAAKVARAQPDGHTILFAHVGVLSVNQHLYREMPYDTAADFAPVGLVCTNPMLLMVSAKAGIADLAALTARAKKGELKIATSGNGSTMHLAALQFLGTVGGKADLIPYRGGGQAVHDLASGAVDMFLEQALGGTPHVKAGTAKAFAVTGPARLDALPEVPTAAEAGLAGLDIQIWNGLTVPRAAAPAIVAAHNAALSTALDDATVRERFTAFAARIPTGEQRAPAALQRVIEHDGAQWGALLRAAGIQKEG